MLNNLFHYSRRSLVWCGDKCWNMLMWFTLFHVRVLFFPMLLFHFWTFVISTVRGFPFLQSHLIYFRNWFLYFFSLLVSFYNISSLDCILLFRSAKAAFNEKVSYYFASSSNLISFFRFIVPIFFLLLFLVFAPTSMLLFSEKLCRQAKERKKEAKKKHFVRIENERYLF